MPLLLINLVPRSYRVTEVNRLAVEGLGTRLIAHISCRSWLSRREGMLNTK